MMTTAIAAVAKLLTPIAEWMTDKTGYAMMKGERTRRKLREEADDALDRGDMVTHERLKRELERLSNAP